MQREAYVWYQKGSLVLYALSDYIGEDKLNLALHNFLMQYRYANATDSQSGPYPDTGNSSRRCGRRLHRNCSTTSPTPSNPSFSMTTKQ